MSDERDFASPPRPLDRADDVDPGATERARLPNPTPAKDPFVDACVLIVNDEDSKIELMMRIAGASNIHTVNDAHTAVERCRKVHPDIVLLDLDKSHVDSDAALSLLRHVFPEDGFLPVLAVTSDRTKLSREQALDSGANDFVTKPLEQVEFVQRVRNLLTMRALYQAVRRHNVALQAELDLHTEGHRQVSVERDRRRGRVAGAITDGALRMVFQPIMDLADGQIVGVEALARFDCEPSRAPTEWFAEAAEVGLAIELDLAAIAASLWALERLPGGAFLSVNSSPATVLSGRLDESLREVCSKRIVIELTEHTRIDDYDLLAAALVGLRGRGVRIAVDDAGSGYAGLQQIFCLRPDIIKLDLAFTRAIDSDPVRRALATSLVSFARDTGAVIIAEGIETTEELDTLGRLGVGWGQGFFLASPGPLSTR
jgi:EAL domain-containing protein (putative c-di-GMP-specific phosphodiesterase class I)/CheY-like chemotaxis protein